ncbi:cystathionine gamma-synthase [Antricoccus suffuscus]|uniref:Cystathionine gamma-synthase n=1 Tax=Antricoccus suffuscus TaxID=1629062 RepID=A0A2T0ZJX2_9ACTN|nr:aminotransferase class I/II-fold pyridoxal phosphate-dependent enzyme [Antricoccus suffuscus]PRZ36605.1 cystathionine gamma-synthase [Antricoccus suffuscus]
MSNDEGYAGWSFDTRAVAVGRPTGAGAPLNTPPVFASSFREGGNDYARFGTPTCDAFEAALGALEGGVAVGFATGMAACAAVLEDLPSGARVVAAANIYHGARTLMRDMEERGRLVLDTVDATDLTAARASLAGAAMLWLESPSNPLLQVLDLEALCRLGKEAGVPVVVDSTFATPVLQNPLAHGAAAVVHSATKYIGGHSDLMMGAVVVPDEEAAEPVRRRRTFHGAMPGAMEAFLALRGLRTLPLRIKAAQQNAMVIAGRLAEHPAVTSVFYPGLPGDPGHELASRQMRGFGAMLSFCVESEDRADEVLARTRLIVMATSLGGVESTAERRNRWNEGAPTGLIRLSVGIEAVEDIWRDLGTALGQPRGLGDRSAPE